MSKYNSLREYRLIKARTFHQCDGCERMIQAKEQYWAERLSGGVFRPPGMKFAKLCAACYENKQSA
ncbi:MAG: hypothetical protein L0Y70_04260 [Gemmataceae bacterium]|nr:hypothetical protein [Gemmataceae bacterium]